MNLIIKLLFWLFALALFFIAQLDTDMGVNNIYIVAMYVFSWFIPVILCSYFKKSYFLYICIINILISLWVLVYILSNNNDNYDFKRDLYSMKLLTTIQNRLENINSYTFDSFEDFSIEYYQGKDIGIPWSCIYLSSTDDNQWYIYAFEYKSNETITKEWTDYFLYKSNPDYTISSDLLLKITDIIKSDCEK